MQWCTADEYCRLYQWDLEHESVVRVVCRLSATIIDVVEVDYLQVLLVATLDKQLRVVDWRKGDTL